MVDSLSSSGVTTSAINEEQANVLPLPSDSVPLTTSLNEENSSPALTSIANKDGTRTCNTGDISYGHPSLISHEVPIAILRSPGEQDLSWLKDPYAGSPGGKYVTYDLPVEHDEGDRAMEIKLLSLKRPHMRALHCAWISFFFSFSIWFAPAPLLKEIQDTLGLSKADLWNSSIANDITAIVLRIIMGPICDAYGARLPMAVVLCVASIPTACVGLVQTSAGLSTLRFFIGIAGSSFVMAQFWPSRMFSREICGTANGIVGGWGNFGGAFTQVFMGSILFPFFRDRVFGGSSEKAWRTICVIPASMAMIWGMIVAFISDDAPMGNYSEMRAHGTMDRILFTTSLRSGAKLNAWILYIQYACSFGVEIVMNNASVLYFTSEFGLSTEDASVLGFAYGSMNLFARGIGGNVSDRLNLSFGLRGRLWWQTILLLIEGAIIILFAQTTTLGGAIATMCAFSLFTQSAEGAIYGVVPYVSKLYTGSVAGLVGAGGNVGSVVFAFGFRSLRYDKAFVMMGCIVMFSSILSIWIRIPCHAGLLSGEDNYGVINARERFKRRRDHNFLNESMNSYRPSHAPDDTLVHEERGLEMNNTSVPLTHDRVVNVDQPSSRDELKLAC